MILFDRMCVAFILFAHVLKALFELYFHIDKIFFVVLQVFSNINMLTLIASTKKNPSHLA